MIHTYFLNLKFVGISASIGLCKIYELDISNTNTRIKVQYVSLNIIL